MRIISQDKTTDVPYEKAVIYFDAAYNTIHARLSEKTVPGFFLGEYENAEDALFVMQRIREVGSMRTHYYDMPSKKDARFQREALEYDKAYCSGGRRKK